MQNRLKYNNSNTWLLLKKLNFSKKIFMYLRFLSTSTHIVNKKMNKGWFEEGQLIVRGCVENNPWNRCYGFLYPRCFVVKVRGDSLNSEYISNTQHKGTTFLPCYYIWFNNDVMWFISSYWLSSVTSANNCNSYKHLLICLYLILVFYLAVIKVYGKIS